MNQYNVLGASACIKWNRHVRARKRKIDIFNLSAADSRTIVLPERDDHSHVVEIALFMIPGVSCDEVVISEFKKFESSQLFHRSPFLQFDIRGSFFSFSMKNSFLLQSQETDLCFMCFVLTPMDEWNSCAYVKAVVIDVVAFTKTTATLRHPISKQKQDERTW